jgi:hypothetical protein
MLSKLNAPEDYSIEEYTDTLFGGNGRDPNALYFDLDDTPRVDPDTQDIFFKRMKISKSGIQKLKIEGDIKDIQKEIDILSEAKDPAHDLREKDILKDTTDSNTVVPGMDPQSQGQKGHTIIFNINAATRAGIHAELDNHLDSLASMAHPTKLVSNF